MSWLRKRWVLLRHPHATIKFEGPVYLGPGFSLHIPDAGTFIAGPGAEFRRGFRAEVAGHGRLKVGAGTVFTYDGLIQCSTTIEIGEDCRLGQNCFIADGSHKFRDHSTHFDDQGYDFKAIRIGDGAIVMSKVTIIDSIGERAVVGANSLVTRPIPPYTLAFGAPAKAVEYFGPDPDEAASQAAASTEA